MKYWLIKHCIAISEITGWSVPGWLRRLVSPETYDRLAREERRLTDALRAPRADFPAMPERLRVRIDQALNREPETQGTGSSMADVLRPVWVMAAAAVLLVSVSVFVINQGTQPVPDSGITTLVAESGTPPDTSSEGPGTQAPVALSEDLILKPLTREQERLAADLTNSVRFLANGFLPREYANRIDDKLSGWGRENGS